VATMAKVKDLEVLVDEQFYTVNNFDLVEVKSPALIELAEEEVAQGPRKQVEGIFPLVGVFLEERPASGLESCEKRGRTQRVWTLEGGL